MSYKLRKAIIEGKLIERIVIIADRALGFVGRKIVYRHGKIDKNKVFIFTYDKMFTCNPAYIAKMLLKQKRDVDIVFVVDNNPRSLNQELPEGIRCVKHDTFAMYEEMASARIWIDNALNCVWDGMPKKKGQVYINTWHGSLGIKKLGGNKRWMYRAKKCNKMTDYCITNSTFEENVFRTTFWKDVPYLRYGHARNDIFFDTEQIDTVQKKVREAFGVAETEKIFLNAPTFRDDGDKTCFNLDYAKVKEALEASFGGKWVIFVRAHYKNSKNASGEEMPEGIIQASAYPDMQELMLAADAGATDYSSWAYDYLLLKRPLFLYASDIKKYNNGRGFYYPLEETPFPIAVNNEEMYRNIQNFNQTEYLERCEKFLEEKGCMDDGKAAERIADKIMEIIEAEK